MTLYLVPRHRAWLTDEELAAMADCLPAVDAVFDDVRWIRSYIVREPDGAYSGYCLYEATSEDALRDHADAIKLPADVILPVASTLVGAPDPAPVTVALAR